MSYPLGGGFGVTMMANEGKGAWTEAVAALFR